MNAASVPRLTRARIDQLDAAVARPGYDRCELKSGQLHLGVGAFMRAHTALYTDEAISAAGGAWGITGVSLRSATVRDRLAPQDCLYTVAVQNAAGQAYRLISCLLDIHVAPENPQRVIELIADPRIKVITLTVTEKGYCLAPDTGRLDISNPAIAADIAQKERPQSLVGFLAAGLNRRLESGGSPVSIVSCDNLPGNGQRLRDAVYAFADLTDRGLAPFLDDAVRFPATMVDRIVPATTREDVDRAAHKIGLRDESLVTTEPFSQWVIEDAFLTDRPRWEAAGAFVTDDVSAYETAKLRLLNGAHSSLAYIGYLAGYEYVHDAMHDKHIARFIRLLMEREISPVTPAPDGMAHEQYIPALLERFRNPALRHRTWQIAMDGSQKLPQRLLATTRQQLDNDGQIAGLAFAVAAWIRYCLGTDERNAPIEVADPLAERFAEFAASAPGDPQALAKRFLSLDEVFGTDISLNVRFGEAVIQALRCIFERGTAASVAAQIATMCR